MVSSAEGMHSSPLSLLTPCFFFLVFGLFVSFIQNLPQLYMNTVICSPVVSWYFVPPGEVYSRVSTAALQQRVPGPSLSQSDILVIIQFLTCEFKKFIRGFKNKSVLDKFLLYVVVVFSDPWTCVLLISPVIKYFYFLSFKI